MKKNFLQDLSRNRLHILFAIFSAIIIILFVFFLKFVYDSKASINSTRVNALHLDYSDRLLINMLNIQTGARGYLLSDDLEFLEPYNEGIKNLENTFNSVEKNILTFKNTPICMSTDSIVNLWQGANNCNDMTTEQITSYQTDSVTVALKTTF